MSGNRRGTTEDQAQDRTTTPVLYVVEDDLPTLELLRELGREWGWATVGFTRLGQVRAALDASMPALLIVDDDLPDGRGGDLVRDLRRDPRLGDMPVVVCTAAASRRRAEITDWAPVLAKPFDLGQVEEFLGATRATVGRAPEGAAG